MPNRTNLDRVILQGVAFAKISILNQSSQLISATATEFNKLFSRLEQRDIEYFASKAVSGDSNVNVIFRNSIFEVLHFKLIPGVKIPIHEHPGMFTFSKVLSGKISSVEYFVKQVDMEHDVAKLEASSVHEKILTSECGSSMTMPFPAFYHSLEALTVSDYVVANTPIYKVEAREYTAKHHQNGSATLKLLG